MAMLPPKVVDDEPLPKTAGKQHKTRRGWHFWAGVEMKDILLAEWTLLLERNKARFNRADFDKISPQIRAVLIEFSRGYADARGNAWPRNQATEPSRLIRSPNCSVSLSEESTTCQIAHESLVDRRVLEREVVNVLGQRQLGDRELVLDRASLNDINCVGARARHTRLAGIMQRADGSGGCFGVFG